MKSYFSNNVITAQGKGWQIRILLNQWKKTAGSNAKIKDFIEMRLSK
ncbi:Z-ring formation inhibitor MciZ [Fontibacillus sp. BL9]